MTQFNTCADHANMEPLIELFRNKGEMVKYKRNEYFCLVGDGCKYIGYIVTGAFRFTCNGTEGKEHIVSYAFENDFIGSYSEVDKPNTNQGLIMEIVTEVNAKFLVTNL